MKTVSIIDSILLISIIDRVVLVVPVDFRQYAV